MKQTVFIIIFLIFAATEISAQDTSAYIKEGDTTPEFSCMTLEGKAVNINELRGKVIMINFFATWCPPCNKELPVLQAEIWDKYKDNSNFVLIVIGREHNENELKEWVSDKGFIMPFVADPERKIYSLFAKEIIPRNIIIDKEGKIAFQSKGFSEEEFAKISDKLAMLME